MGAQADFSAVDLDGIAVEHHGAGGWKTEALPGWRIVVYVRDGRLRVSCLQGLGAIRSCCMWAPVGCPSELAALRAVLPVLVEALGAFGSSKN
jgi:hypothetical protein